MNAIQPFLVLTDAIWIEVKDGDPRGRALFHRHYSYRRRKNGKVPKLYIGPGFKLVLVTADARAVFAWRKHESRIGQDGIECTIFHNERPSDAGQASDMIREADEIAFRRWPGERHYTFVNAGKTAARRSRRAQPGECFIRAGWRFCGHTKGGLHILERRP